MLHPLMMEAIDRIRIHNAGLQLQWFPESVQSVVAPAGESGPALSGMSFASSGEVDRLNLDRGWPAIHRYPLWRRWEWGDCQRAEAARWFSDWNDVSVPADCNCMADWREWTRDHPPVFDTWEGMFEWGVDAHNHVNSKKVKPTLTVQEAMQIWLPAEPGMFPPWWRKLPSMRRIEVYGPRCLLVIAPEAWAQQQIEITRPSLQAYARRCNAQYLEIRTDCYPDWPMGNKLLAWEISELFDQTLYVDCDVVIKPSCPDLFSSTPPGWYAVQDELPTVDHCADVDGYQHQCLAFGKRLGYTHLPAKVPNGGVMLLPRGGAAYRPPSVAVAADWCMDQFLLAYQLPEDRTRWIDDRFNWGFIRKDWRAGWDQAWAIHCNGCHGRQERLKLLREAMDLYC